ncbi:MAG: hypothetical protein WBF51_02080 [Candidatus Dormiibacterota bacterium]
MSHPSQVAPENDGYRGAAAPRAIGFRFAVPAARALFGVVVLLLIATVVLSGPSHQPITLANSAFTFAFATFALAGFVVALRQPRNAIGWIMLGTALFGFLNSAGGAYAAWDYRFSRGALPLGVLAVFLELGFAPTLALFPLPLLLFPDGHLPSQRWRWVMWSYLVVGTLWVVLNVGEAATGVLGKAIKVDPTGQLTVVDHPTGLAVLLYGGEAALLPVFLGFWVVWVVRLVASYRRGTGERRQQFKWFLAGAAVSGIGLALSFATPTNDSVMAQVLGLASAITVCALPLGLGIAILKYRLYDVDRLISRTLSYAIVTGLLIGVYVGLVTLATRVLPFSSPLGVAASTLVAVALFNPLRRRVQRLVDRRFNRARYDAEATVSAFAQRVRDDVDLAAVSSEFVRAVQTSVEPAHLSLWLRPTGSGS